MKLFLNFKNNEIEWICSLQGRVESFVLICKGPYVLEKYPVYSPFSCGHRWSLHCSKQLLELFSWYLKDQNEKTQTCVGLLDNNLVGT